MPLAIPFDDACATLGPLADLRPTYEIRTGAMTALERLRLAGFTVPTVRVPDAASPLASERTGLPANDPGPIDSDTLIVNGRWTGDPASLDLTAGAALIEAGTGALIAARLTAGEARAFVERGSAPDLAARPITETADTLTRPWHAVARLHATLARDLDALSTTLKTRELPGVTVIGDPSRIRLHETTRVYPGVVLDVEDGPIVLAQDSVVRPGAIVRGPSFLGRGSTILDSALIKQNTSVGPVCKVAGEVGSTVLQGFSNKAHDGHLGDAWLGEWVNLGAATVNSNLLNTYEEASAKREVDAPRERTGLTFLGCIVGDHVKTAIGTRMMTGAVIGTGSMIATTAAAPTSVGRFRWLTDAGDRAYRLSKFMDVARAAMSRRKIDPGEAYTRAIADLHARSQKDSGG